MSLGVAPETRAAVYPAIQTSNFVGALKDKVAFVTGAGRGIGRAIALAFAQSGAHVALLSRTRSELDEVAEIIRSKFSRKALVFAVDATDNSAVAEAFARTEKELGKLDIVVPNAATSFWRPFAYLAFDDWWTLMELNVKAPLFLTQLAIKSMRERNNGTVIAISSAAALSNIPGASAYCTSKTALNRAIGCLQLELDAEGKSGIHLYAVHPGGVKTQLATDFSIIHEDMDKLIPGMTDRIKDFLRGLVNPPELCAQTCVYLACGKARELRGKYINAQRDIESVVEQAEIVKKANLYDLGIRELGEAGRGAEVSKAVKDLVQGREDK